MGKGRRAAEHARPPSAVLLLEQPLSVAPLRELCLTSKTGGVHMSTQMGVQGCPGNMADTGEVRWGHCKTETPHGLCFWVLVAIVAPAPGDRAHHGVGAVSQAAIEGRIWGLGQPVPSLGEDGADPRCSEGARGPRLTPAWLMAGTPPPEGFGRIGVQSGWGLLDVHPQEMHPCSSCREPHYPGGSGGSWTPLPGEKLVCRGAWP